MIQKYLGTGQIKRTFVLYWSLILPLPAKQTHLTAATIKHYFSLVKFSHTIFAMPFALIGFTLAVSREDMKFEWALLIQVVLCMVFARNSAMAFNRYIDEKFDKLNPRTAVREIPAGLIPKQNALGFVMLNCLLFAFTTFLSIRFVSSCRRWPCLWSCFTVIQNALHRFVIWYSAWACR
ncbi:hypothetical protein EMGBS15_14790 [Filimonas sp.]|nr:hypothetical protein EMGBS15_14790 [Filimonas sp.]